MMTIKNYFFQNKTHIALFYIFFVQLFVINYYHSYVSNKIESNFCTNQIKCIAYFELLKDKCYFSKKIFYAGILMNIILMLTYKKIQPCLKNIFGNNLHSSKEMMIKIHSLLYLLSFIYKPILFYLAYYNDNYYIKYENYSDLGPVLNYLIMEILYFIFLTYIFIFYILTFICK